MKYPFYFTWTAQKVAEPFTVEGAAGGEFILPGGRRAYDAISCSYQASFGHSHSKIMQKLKIQFEEALVLPPKAVTTQRVQVSDRLLKLLGQPEGGSLFYTISGAESVENALKMARQIRSANVVVAREKSYHGGSMAAMSVTGDWRGRTHFGVQSETLRIPEPINDPQAQLARSIIENFGPEKIAAFCLETITGANGVWVPPKSWWDGIQAIADDHGILLILDEVFCGFGRTGKHFGFQHYSLRPDFICLAKNISAGYIPFGAVWTTERVRRFYETNVLSCGLTNYAHPLGIAALDGVLDELEDPVFQKHLGELVSCFAKCVHELEQEPTVATTRQVGMLAAIEFSNKGQFTFADFWKEGVYLQVREDLFLLAPPFVLNQIQIEDIFARIRKVLRG